tara:strand:- start:5975 stop:19717 length:13743 start_codon:yes stop_codon:yes gene_type:complete
MENQNDTNLKDQSLASTIQAAQRPHASVVPPGQDFIPVTDMFENAYTSIADTNAIDPSIISGVNRYKNELDQYGIPALASLGVARPSLATGTYDPVAQQNPPANDFSKIQQILNENVSEGPANDIAAPRFVNMRSSQFDRYFNNRKFDSLGFTPYSNTEEYYNQNSDVYDDMARMFGQYTSLAGSGFSSVYRSIGDFFDGDNYAYAPDISTAMEFEDAMRIGNSSRDGGMAWTNNLLLNSAYTMGIIGSIAVEELALFAAAGVQGFLNPASDALLLGRTAVNIGRGVNALKQYFTVFRGLDAGRDIYRTLKSADAAKDFWTAANAGGRILGKAFAPNTLYALKNFKTAQNATQNGINIAKAANTFGGFYRDVRSINLALAESKLEGGMVYNQLVRDGIRIHEEKTGRPVTPDDMAKIESAASKGSFYTTMANAPIIYASNWFVLGNAMGGFNRTLGRVFNDSYRKGFKSIVKTGATRNAKGVLNKNVFENVGANIFGTIKKVKAGGWKGLVGSGGAAMLRYAAANIAEGVQEVSQEAVSAATTGYYNEIMKDPLAGGLELRNTMIANGIGSQLSSEGFSVFMSGFLMGGVVQLPQKLFFQGVPSIYKYGANQAASGLGMDGGAFGSKGQNEAWAEYKKERDGFLKDILEQHNTVWNNQIDDPTSLFDETKFNFFMQKQLADSMKEANGQDMFAFKDDQDASKFQQMNTIFQQGTSQIYRSQLTDMLKLTNEELYEAYSGSAGVKKSDIKNGKIRERLTNMVEAIDKQEQNYLDAIGKFPQPFDPSKFKKGTPEFQEAVLSANAWNHARYLYMFTQDGFTKALERSNKIYSLLENEPIFEKMAAKDLTVLLSAESIDAEIKMLKDEKKVFQDSDQAPQTKQIADKAERIAKLEAIRAVLTNRNYITKSSGKRKGSFDRRYIKKLTPAFTAYVKYLAGTEDSFVSEDNINKALIDIVDHIALKERAKVYDKAIEYLGNPERFSEIFNRQLEYNKQYFSNIKENFEENLKKYTSIEEANQLMNQLASLNPSVFSDPEEAKLFLETNDVKYLKTFYTDTNQISGVGVDGNIIVNDKVLHEQIKAKLRTHAGIQETEVSDQPEVKPKTESELSNEAAADVEDTLGNMGINVVLDQPNNTPMLNALLKKEYRKYQATASIMGDPVISFDRWRDSQEGVNLQNGFNALKKIWAAGKMSNNPSTQEIEYIRPLSSEVVISEKGFEQWALSRETQENPQVRRVLDQLGLKLSDIFVNIDVVPDKGSNIPGDANRKVIEKGSTAALIKIDTIDVNSGDRVSQYKITDLNGNNLSKNLLNFLDQKNQVHRFGTFTTLGKALAAYKIIEATAPDTSIFPFDGVEGLNQGMLVYKDNEPFIILSNPGEAANGYLKIIPAALNTPNKKELKSNTITLQPGQFKGVYIKQDLDTTKFNANVARIDVNEPITPYKAVNQGESSGKFGHAEARYNLIVGMLSADELANLEFVISVPKNSGEVSERPFSMTDKDGVEYLSPNPLIKLVKSKYQIGIRIKDAAVNNKLMDALNKLGLPPNTNEGNFFAFLNNQYIVMEDLQGKPVDPRSMSKSQMLNTIFPGGVENMSNEELLNLVHNNFALNSLIVSELDQLALTTESGEVSFINGFGQFGLKVDGGKVAYAEKGKQIPRPVSDLLYNDSDGNGGILIYDFKYDPDLGKRTVQTVTNLEGDAQSKLRADVKEGLGDRYNDMITGSDRYYVIVKLPNGTYAPVNLKSRKKTLVEVTALYTRIISRAQDTLKDNKKGDVLFNEKFNEETNNELFISNKPGYIIDLEVSPFGQPQFVLKKKLGKDNFEEKARIEISKDVVRDAKLGSAKEMQTLIDDFNNDEAVRGEGVKLSPANFRQSFPDGASVETILEKSTTNVLSNVIEQQKLRVTGDDAAIQASKDVAFIRPLKPDEVKPLKNPTNEELGDDGINGLSDELFDEQLEREFEEYSNQTLQAIVNKILRGLELNAREENVYKYLESRIELLVLNQGGRGSKAEATKVVESPLQRAKQELDIYKEELLEGVPFKDHAKALKESKQYQSLIKNYKQLAKIANKLLKPSLTPLEIEEIDTFIDWANINLPDYISVQTLENLRDNFQSNNERVGAFMLNMSGIGNGVEGTIFTKALSPFKYHEAFHGVFRMLLSQEEIVKFRNIARKEVRKKLRAEGKSFKKELGIFRNSASTYTNMTEKELENEYYEEYLADEFEKFKMDPKSSNVDAEVKSFFTRLIEWLKSLFNNVAQDELQTLFKNIDTGKYQQAQVAKNEFTAAMNEGPIVANALLPYSNEQVKDLSGNIRSGTIYLNSDISNPLIGSMAAMFLNRVSKVNGSYNPASVLEVLMSDFQTLYHPLNPANESLTEEQLAELSSIQDAFNIYPEEITKAVVAQLNTIGTQVENEQFTLDEFEDSTGVRTTSQYDKDASLIGGFNSLSSSIRGFIATTNLVASDQGVVMDLYGNTELESSDKNIGTQPLIIPVDAQYAYNALLKAVKNTEDTKQILEQMYAFGVDNPHAGAVVNRILNRVGISPETLLSKDPLPVNFVMKDPGFLQSIIKGFQNYRVNYIFNERDEYGNIRIYSAAQRDDINAQLDKWNQAYISKKKRFNNQKVQNQIEELLDGLNDLLISNKSITNKLLNAKASQYSIDLFNLVGIKLSPLYIRFSALKGKPSSVLNVSQASLVRNNIDQLSINEVGLNQTSKTVNEYITTIEELRLGIQRNADIFSKGNDGIASRLYELSQNNAAFDETVGASVFKNPNGDLVFAHQLPTYHLKQVKALNNISTLDSLKANDPYLTNNYLLNSTAFRNMSNKQKLQISRIAGSKIGQELNTEADLNEFISGVKSTQTYGEFTPQEFAITMINNYTAFFNIKSNKVDRVLDAEGNEVGIAPVLVRVMEASNTGDMLGLPVIKAVETVNGDVKITDTAIDIVVNEIATEFSRINREAQQLNDAGRQLIKGYNVNENGRAFKINNNKLALSEELRTRLERVAIEQGKEGNTITLQNALSAADTSIGALKEDINKSLESQFNKFQDTLDELNVRDQFSKYIKDGLAVGQGVSRKETLKSARLLNLNYLEEHNLKQIFINDYINTLSINQVLLGDEAMSLKDPIDQVKRAKMQNAAYYSAYSSFSAPLLGVDHNVEDISLITFEEPKGQSSITGEDIDRADAQMYITTKAFRYMWFGFGKLTEAQAKLIDAIESGQTLPLGTYDLANELFGNEQSPIGLVDQQAMLNSKKLVYGDGKTFLKMSAFVLTPQYTSTLDDQGKWVAKPNKIELHNLRIKLEALENKEGAQTLGIAAPESASKMMKQNINNIEQLGNTREFTEGVTNLDARMMGLQVLNPSNKLDIIDPTQIKEILSSEQNDSVLVAALNMTVGEIRAAYNQAVSQRVELKFKDKRNLIFTLGTSYDELAVSKEQGKLTPNLQAFLNYAVNSLNASQSSETLLDFFSSTNGVQNYDLNNPITVKKFEQLFLSYFSKGTLSERAPGVSLTLVSDFGNKVYRRVYEVDANGVPVRSEVIRENVFNKNPEALVELDSLVKGDHNGVVVLDRLRTGLMGYTNPKDKSTATGERYSEMIMPAHYKDIMTLVEEGTIEMPESISKMFAVRIPTQDNHSAMAVKMVDFMPAYYGSTAMFSQELIEISGADFDIDKVFALIKEFYVKDNKFVEYSQEGSYDEYFRYISEKVLKSGSMYAEAANLWVDEQSESKTPITLAEENNVTDAGLSERGLQALKILGLPITKAQYALYVAKFGVPYAAPLNNKLVDYKYALVSNTGVTESKTGIPISYQSADQQIITDVLTELAGESDYFKNKVEENISDINNLNGKILAFKANKGASIGAFVLPNLYLSLLTEYKSQLKEPITVNGKSYSKYGVTVMENGDRKQDVNSSLVTMATDNAKDRNVGKLGLNRNASAVLMNMVALGIPLKTAVLLINVPKIQNLYIEAINKTDMFDAGIVSLVKAELKDNTTLVSADLVTDEMLLDAINNSNTENEKQILELFLQVLNLTAFTGNMGAVTGLTKGLGKSIVDINTKAESIEKLMDPKAPIDLSNIYKGKTFQNTYLKIFYQIKEKLLPTTFLTASADFSVLADEVFKEMNTKDLSFTEETKEKVRLDLLSYLTIKAYDNHMMNNNSRKVATLNNQILYPSRDSESVVDAAQRLFDWAEVNDPNNFFIMNFLDITKADNIDNTTGLNLAMANTFRQINSVQKLDLVNDFNKLYTNVQTKDDAQAIVNYIMVKDGLQLGYGSLLSAIAPQVLNDYLDQVDSVRKTLEGEVTFGTTFNSTQEELIEEFKVGYLTSNITGPLLPNLVRSELTMLPKPVKLKGDKLTIEFKDDASIKNYVRIANISELGGAIYKTYKANAEQDSLTIKYSEVPTYGSNQQTAIGFMFNTPEFSRPTYAENREYVKNKNNQTSEESKMDKMGEFGLSEAAAIEQDVLNDTTNDIVATNKSVDANGINMADTDALMKNRLEKSAAIENIESEVNTLEDTENALPTIDVNEQGDYAILAEDILGEASQFPLLSEGYANIMSNPSNKSIMMENKLFPFSNMISEYNNNFVKEKETEQENQEAFLDQLKCLGIK